MFLYVSHILYCNKLQKKQPIPLMMSDHHSLFISPGWGIFQPLAIGLGCFLLVGSCLVQKMSSTMWGKSVVGTKGLPQGGLPPSHSLASSNHIALPSCPSATTSLLTMFPTIDVPHINISLCHCLLMWRQCSFPWHRHHGSFQQSRRICRRCKWDQQCHQESWECVLPS